THTRERLPDHNCLRPASAPAPECRGAPKAQIDHGSPFLARIGQRDPELFGTWENNKFPLEEAFVIRARDRPCECYAAWIRRRAVQLVRKFLVHIRRHKIDAGANSRAPSCTGGVE